MVTRIKNNGRKTLKQTFLLLLATGVIGVGVVRGDNNAAKPPAVVTPTGPFCVVKIADLERRIIYKILKVAEYNDLKKTIEKESVIYPKALEMARQAWPTEGATAAAATKSAKNNGTPSSAPVLPPFPASMLSPRALEDCGTFVDNKEAEIKLKEMEAITKRETPGYSKNPKNKPRIPKNVATEMAAESNVVMRAGIILQEKIDTVNKNRSSYGL